ncbi:DNA-directed RNA polymerase III subunit RPC3 [Eumeta japonica]|uniref:DNA-directed RNA polymerase III subunit RPC3 n=1 Tax=Eumeta variegata TaxID=151549 RepID=A0A4C1XP31_EUMVA|nr:DNA-directed RNA polymerase III subunit RPC3 [Eumeta japonica]
MTHVQRRASGCGLVIRCGEAGGGRWAAVPGRAAALALEHLLDATVMERLGHHAARIFRLIRSKKYIEEEEIQKHAMLPNKQCKELTYRLLEDHFISVQPMRKAASSGSMAKAVYLYHINTFKAANMVLEMCYRATCNMCHVGALERRRHARLLDKVCRVRTIVHGMRTRGEPQENIDDIEDTVTPPERAALAAAERRLHRLSAAELELDRALFVLHCSDSNQGGESERRKQIDIGTRTGTVEIEDEKRDLYYDEHVNG